MQAQASINLAHNTKLIRKRKQKLQQLGHFRLHQPNTKLVGLKQRIDSNRWSKDIFKVKDFPADGIVEDEFDRSHPTKLVLPVPGDSSKILQETKDDLEPFAIQLRNQLIDGDLFTTIKLTSAGKDMKRVPNFTQTLRKSKLSFKHLFSDSLTF